MPVFVAEHVLGGYGTGVVMGVPAHDARDHAFARRHSLPVVTVVAGGEPPYAGEGPLERSGPFTGLVGGEARDAIAARLEETGAGRRSVRYRLRDWLVSRQRYWGPPIPIVHCAECGEVRVPDEALPVVLPEVEDFRPTGTGVSPLAAVSTFVEVPCPRCGGAARRETDVLDTFVDSSWYFLRYPCTDLDDRPWDPERTGRVLPVDRYEGGQEHVRRHHLYARFVSMALHDLGLTPVREPIPRIGFHGLMVMAGAKMSKSRGNVVTPEPYWETIGADNLRAYLLFAGPWEEGPEFSADALQGVVRFTARVWRLVTADHEPGPGLGDLREVDRTTARVARDMEAFKFHTAIAALMEFVSWATEHRAGMTGPEWERVRGTLVLLLAPFVPHLAEELWEAIGGGYSVHEQPWPAVDEAALADETVTIVVQVDGRIRGSFQAAAGLGEDEVLEQALSIQRVRDALGGRGPDRVVFVPDRLVNLVREGG